ncbi:MAG: hypothetical protein R2940_15090 [Syntrophotaleaceae bacterium]
MKSLRLILRGLTVAVSLSLTACGGGGGGGGGGEVSVADTVFDVAILANLTGGSFSAGIAINPTGMTVGYGEDATSIIKGVRWDAAAPAAAPEQLDPLGGDSTLYSAAYGINPDGTAVGESEDGLGNILAVHWPAGTTTPQVLSTVGLPAGNSAAYAMNANGEIVGEAGSGTNAVYWPAIGADPIILGNLSNDPAAFSAAYFINDAGFVVGESLNALGAVQAVVWTPGAGGVFTPGQAPLPLTEITGQTGSVAFGVDLSGNIVGEAEVGADVFGMVWNPDGTVKSTLPAATSVQSINYNNRMVGYVNANTGTDNATIWNAVNIADNQRLTLATFSQAYGINDNRQIVGIAGTQAFVATPASP